MSDDGIMLPELLDPAPSHHAASAPTPATVPAATAAAASTATARAPLTLQPMPSVRPSTTAPAPVDAALATYLRKCGELKGMVSCCIFELATQRTVGHVGARPGPAALASHGASLIASMAEASHALNLGDAPPDAAVTLGHHHLIVRTVPGRRGMAMHAVFDKVQANLTLVRLQMQRLDMLLEEGATD
jgi:hypothetical protein